jgi:hypothetical protein
MPIVAAGCGDNPEYSQEYNNPQDFADKFI